jgi:hypothetical protein
MSYVQSHKVSVTTGASSGGATTYTGGLINGHVDAIRYVKTDFADGSTFTITGENTGIAILTESSINASATRFPRAATQDIVGAASLYAALGEPVETKVAIADERIKIIVASAGNSKTGTFYILTS